MLAKAELRQHLLVQRARLTPADIEQKSAVIAAYACALLAFCVRHTVMVYMALPQEVQTTRIVAQARVWHKRIAVPVVQGDSLAAVELPDDPAQLRRGRFGILEPYETQAVISPEEIGYIGQRVATQRQRRASEERVRQVLQEAEREAESKIREALLEAKDSWYQTKARLEQEADATKLELQRLEKKILLREENLERKIE